MKGLSCPQMLRRCLFHSLSGSPVCKGPRGSQHPLQRIFFMQTAPPTSPSLEDLVVFTPGQTAFGKARNAVSSKNWVSGGLPVPSRVREIGDGILHPTCSTLPSGGLKKQPLKSALASKAAFLASAVPRAASPTGPRGTLGWRPLELGASVWMSLTSALRQLGKGQMPPRRAPHAN